jgi:hypothetical protein
LCQQWKPSLQVIPQAANEEHQASWGPSLEELLSGGDVESLPPEIGKKGLLDDGSDQELEDMRPLERTRNASIYGTTMSAPLVTPPRPETMSSRHAEGIVPFLLILYSLYQIRSTYWRISYAPILLLSLSHMLPMILRELSTILFGRAYSFYPFAFDITLHTFFFIRRLL